MIKVQKYMRHMIMTKTLRKGFTLVEMIIAVFIFLMVILALVTIFAAQMRAYKHARSAQVDLENAQFALNYLGKTLRTATLVGKGVTPLTSLEKPSNNADDYGSIAVEDEPLILYDFSQDLCIRLSLQPWIVNSDHGELFALIVEEVGNNPYDTDALANNAPTSIAYDRVGNCLNGAIYTPGNPRYHKARLTSGDVSVGYRVQPTRYQNEFGSRQTDTMGRATISLRVWPADRPNRNEVRPVFIQTTTALRDYPPDLSF